MIIKLKEIYNIANECRTCKIEPPQMKFCCEACMEKKLKQIVEICEKIDDDDTCPKEHWLFKE